MTPDSAFLNAILDDPDDDTARLVFADWLDDRGDARGELIRVQCRLAAWEPDLVRRTQLLQREAELIAQYGRKWLGPFYADCTRSEFRRGFAHLTMPATDFVRQRSAKRTAELLRRARVEVLRLRGTPAEIAGLRDAAHLKSVAALDLSGNGVDDDVLLNLLASPHLARLNRLDLSNNRITDLGVRMLLEAPFWERLTWLDLHNNRISPLGARALLAERHGRFDLRGNDLDAETLVQLAVVSSSTEVGRNGDDPRRVNSLGMAFARIPAGTFLMGSPQTEEQRKLDEGPQRPITLTTPFFLGLYPVTQQEYERVMGVNRSEFTLANGGGPSHPAEHVNWEDAVEFCQRLSERPEERAAGRTYRLPTEAEWEHACRAGSVTAFHFGPSLTSTEANMHGGQPYFAPRGRYLERTTPVGSFGPNAFGLHDMHGNVWEWCQDWYSETYLREVADANPVGPESGTNRSQRGGCWGAYGECCRSAYRASNDPPGRRLNCLGFRVVLSIGERGTEMT